MIRKLALLAVTLLIAGFAANAFSAMQPGKTDTVFNRRFIPKIKPMMPYDQIVGMVGNQGAKTREEKSGAATITSYRWNGGKKSVLNIRVSGGRLIDATILAPNGHTYYMGKKGDVKDLGD